MANMNKQTHDKLFPLIKNKQKGEYCLNCFKSPFELQSTGQDPNLVIDHKNNNNADNRLENLQLLCRSCNTKKNHWRKAEPFERSATPEIIINRKNENRFRNYTLGRILDPVNNGSLEHDSLIADGAEFIGCSVQAIKNYLIKMTSPEHGLYTWEARPDGFVYLILK